MKPFSEREFIKDCLIIEAEKICPKLVNKFKSVSISGKTITRRIDELGRDLAKVCYSFHKLRLSLEFADSPLKERNYSIGDDYKHKTCMNASLTHSKREGVIPLSTLMTVLSGHAPKY